ncbi:MAG TPA: phosphoribosylanthranilate isomerase [Planktothrix sp.]|jgi:phosphoribosylanthranilate isomerase
MPPQVKICGVTSVHDAITAIKCGASYVGLIFVPSSKRAVTLAVASEIVAAVRALKRGEVVAVFQNADFERMRDVVTAIQPDFVQCHGSESPQYCHNILSHLGCAVIKAIEVDPYRKDESERLEEAIATYSQSCRMLLFDRPKSAPSDQPWLERTLDILPEILGDTSGENIETMYFFAGGLTAENVDRVLSRLTPFGVDVASGVESAPGCKDKAKMEEFIKAVKRSNARQRGLS